MTDVFRSLCIDLVRIADAIEGGNSFTANQCQALDGFSALANFRALADTARKKLAKSEQPESGLPSDGGYEVGTMWAGHGTRPEPVGRPVWTEGVCGDGAAILKDGVMQPIEDVVAALNAAEVVRLKPVGPSLEEVEDLCEEHEFCVEGYESTECLQGLINDAVARYSGPTIAPISLKERLPKPEDCNERGECWHWQQGPESWELISPPENYYVFDEWTHFLPHWALPIPSQNP